jgi:acyl carrier protein
MVSEGGLAAITEEIRGLVEGELGRPVEGDPTLDDLGLDSLQRLSLAVALEDRFRVVLSELDAATLVRLSDLAQAIQRLGGTL